MLPAPKSQAELQLQRAKLTNSYNALLQEFSSKELSTVGNYDVGHLIGKGSFGKVYLASHKLIRGSKVVLKQANKEDANLAREIHHHRQFLHPHIARLYEVIATESSVWLVLEYCSGDELYHYLTKHGPIEPVTVQKIFTQLVGAVSYVHSKSCVHRDLKLENILLDKHDNVKLCDFGFTREYEGKSSYLQTWCGTVCYSAPEMLKGEKYAGEKVDVWSLGIILYALLCGELPFDEEDETMTKIQILKEEPKYPESMPQGARELIVSLLSKRPILRPSLADILTNPWLGDYAPQQQAILKLPQPLPFSTTLESDTLHRARSAGVDTDAVVENVLSQRCDALAGWWGLLLEKEERREERRQRKRKEREKELRASRRISAASSRLLSMAIKESEEEKLTDPITGDTTDHRGRYLNSTNGSVSTSLPDSPMKPTPIPRSEASPSPATPPLRPAIRQINTPRPRSQLALQDHKRRSGTLQMVVNDPTILDATSKNIKRRYQQPFLNHLASIKHWFKGSHKQDRGPPPQINPQPPITSNTHPAHHIQPASRVSIDAPQKPPTSSSLHPDVPHRTPRPPRPTLTTQTSNPSPHRRRSSHSPSPITPQSSFRRPSTQPPHNLRGRKSTSSSISSAPSIHAHHPSHSKGSSTSSNSIGPASHHSATAQQRRLSGTTPVKKLPAPAGLHHHLSGTGAGRGSAVRGGTEATAAFGGFAAGPSSPGFVFARRKRTPFRGPIGGAHGSGGGGAGGGGGGLGVRRRSEPGGGGGGGGGVGGGGSRSGSVQGRRSGELKLEDIQDEDEEGEEEVEEVDYFSPVTGPGEVVVEEGEGG